LGLVNHSPSLLGKPVGSPDNPIGTDEGGTGVDLWAMHPQARRVRDFGSM